MAARSFTLNNRSMLARRIAQIFQGEDGEITIPLGILPGTLIYNQRREYVTTVPLEVGTEGSEQEVAVNHH